jgi:hypothetical protein
MLFYCPNCKQEQEVEPKETITTKSKRLAYKASCPVCNQDMAEFTEFMRKSPETESGEVNTPNRGQEVIVEEDINQEIDPVSK